MEGPLRWYLHYFSLTVSYIIIHTVNILSIKGIFRMVQQLAQSMKTTIKPLYFHLLKAVFSKLFFRPYFYIAWQLGL